MSESQIYSKINIYRIIRYGLTAVLIAAVIIMLSGNKESNASFDKVSSAVSGSITTDKAMKGTERYLKKNFGLNADDYDSVLIYIPATNMNANEMVLIKLKDVSQADSVQAAIENRIESQINIFEGYAPEATALLKNAILDVRGNYILYIVDSDAVRIDDAFRSSL